MKIIVGLLGVSVIGFFAWVWWHGKLPDIALFSFTSGI